MKNSNVLTWIVAALFLFAIGYLGVLLYHDQQNKAVQNQPKPALPSASYAPVVR